MIYSLKPLIKRSRFVSKAVVLLLKFKTRGSLKESERRKKLAFTTVDDLAKPIVGNFDHPVFENNYYGINRVLARYCGLKKLNDRLYIEHGLVLGTMTYDITNSSFANCVITFGQFRASQIQLYRDYPAITIGPYIHYAKSLLNENSFHIEKNTLGRTLLVFPSHSIGALRKEFDVDGFIDEIDNLAKNFDSTVVCLYWKDVQLGRAEAYYKKGFKVVTAGHFNDIYFLGRLKAIISLADYTVSNEVGTHIGYCVYMNKPHYLISQKITYSPNAKQEDKFDREVNFRSLEEKASSEECKMLFRNAFGLYTSSITNEQKKLVNYFWGINEIKSTEELKKLLK